MDESLDCQLAYWNGPGSAKEFAHPVNHVRLGELLARDSAIVDLGCGRGRVLKVLSDRGYQDLCGLDLSPAMIGQARQQLPTARFETVASAKLPLADASVDAVLLFAVLTCIPTDRGQRTLVGEIVRVLRPGGLLHISDYWIQADERNRERYARFAPEFGTYGVFRLPEGAVFRHHEREWIAELTRAFRPVGLDEIRVRTMNGHAADGFQWYGRKAEHYL